MPYLIAQISDPHLAPLPRLAPGEFAAKRIAGLVNWHRSRRWIHDPAVLAALIDDLKQHKPDHIVVTGDLTNLGLDREIEAARHWLEALAPPDQLTLIPGNHDAYVPGAVERANAAWMPYMTSDPLSLADREGEMFPFIRRRGPVALIGLSSAIPTRLFSATGRVDGRQIVRLADDLVNLSRDGFFRMVLVHHPLAVARGKWAKRLENAGTLRTVLTTAGAELVLHGHMHVPDLITIPGPTAPINVFSVPSASSRGGRHPAGYALHRIEDLGEAGFSWSFERRGLTETGTFATVETNSFTLPKWHA